MKKFYYIFLILFISLININNVKADEGIVYSVRSCFGKTYGIHNNHWHEAVQKGNDWIAVGDPINTYPCTPSNDPTLKSITINNTSINVQDKMEFETYDETANILATPAYAGAQIEYEQNKKLEIGNNLITIKITGASGLSKTYELNIIRKKILSTNNNIKKITIDGKEYKFKENNIDDIFVTSNQKSLDIKIETEDKTAKVNIKNNKLKSGDNKVTIIVKAENGSVQEYYINYHKTLVLSDILGLIIGILILASPIIIILIIIHFKNKKRYINNSHYYKTKKSLFKKY